MSYVEVITPYVSLFFCHWKIASPSAFPCRLFIALKISLKYLYCTPWVREEGVAAHWPSPRCQTQRTHIILILFTALGAPISVITICLLSAFEALPH